MNQSYWDSVSMNYQDEILSVYDNDTQGLVRERIAACAVSISEGRAADLGCGVGRFTPLLADTFETVEACDFTSVGLKQARKRCRDRSNVNFYKVDLAKDVMPFEPVDFAFCVNVLIMPSLDQRMRAWRNVTSVVVHGGTILIIAPSLESVQMEHYHTVDSHLSNGESCAEALRQSVQEKATTADLRMGVHQLDGVKTKHYLREEIKEMLVDREFDIVDICKLRYPPNEDEARSFTTWDWLVVAKRR